MSVNIRKHNPKFIEKWIEENKTGFVVSLPGAPVTQFADGETVLGRDVTIETDAVLKVVTAKAFSKTAQLPSLARIQDIESRLDGFLRTDVYRQTEDLQNQRLEQLLQNVDLKDLDITVFQETLLQLATKQEIASLQQLIAAEKQINETQQRLISELNEALKLAVIEEVNFSGNPTRIFDPNNQTYGPYRCLLNIPVDRTISCVRVYQDGLKMNPAMYQYTDFAVVFANEVVTDNTILDLEVTLKKK